VEQREKKRNESADAGEALQEIFVARDAFFQFAKAAGLSVAEKLAHLRLEDGEIGEDLGFEVRHFVSF
jgi:hypothetical protein